MSPLTPLQTARSSTFVMVIVLYCIYMKQVLVTDKKIDQVNDLIPILETMVKAKEPLFIVAEDVVGEALSALVVNKMRGVLDVVSYLVSYCVIPTHAEIFFLFSAFGCSPAIQGSVLTCVYAREVRDGIFFFVEGGRAVASCR